MWRGARRPPSTTVGCVESMTMRWAIQAPGSAITASRVASISSRVGARGDQDADAAVAGARLEDELVEHVERFFELLRLCEVVGRDGAQDGLLADVEADHLLDVGVGELVVGDAGAVLVDEPEHAGADGLDQQAAEVGVQAVGVGAPVDDVDPPRLAQAARQQPQLAVAELELVAARSAGCRAGARARRAPSRRSCARRRSARRPAARGGRGRSRARRRAGRRRAGRSRRRAGAASRPGGTSMCSSSARRVACR